MIFQHFPYSFKMTCLFKLVAKTVVVCTVHGNKQTTKLLKYSEAALE